MNSRLRRQRREVIEAKHGEWPVDDVIDTFKAISAPENAELFNAAAAHQAFARQAAEQIKEQR